MNRYLSCAAPTLTALPVYDGDCDPNESPINAQLVGLIVLPISARLPVDWTDAGDVTDSVANATTDNGVGKFLFGKGGIPAPVLNEITLGRIHRLVTSRLYTVTIEMLIACPAHRTFLNLLQTNWKGFTFWPYTSGDILIGGAGGIVPSFVSVDMPIGAERTSVEVGIITIQFRADGDPPRTSVPGLFTAAAGLVPPAENLTIVRQYYPNQTSADLVWTENGGEFPTPYANYVFVYRNGQKLIQSVDYTVTADYPSPGQSTITITNHIEGDYYETFAFLASA